jgi:hypothetical protein
MNTLNLAAAPTRPGFTLQQLLNFDALTCLLMGVALALGAGPLASLLGLPQTLLFYAGLALFPCAALMAITAKNQNRALVWTVILGNVAWVIGSVFVAFTFEVTALGMTFVLAQALAVDILVLLEWRALRAQR